MSYISHPSLRYQLIIGNTSATIHTPNPKVSDSNNLLVFCYLVFQVLDFLVYLQGRKSLQTDDLLFPVNE